jgi:alpha-mannosidase
MTRLEKELWTYVTELSVEASDVSDEFRSYEEALKLPYAAVEKGETFGPVGGAWKQRWFRLTIPEEHRDEGLYLYWECDGEATVYVNGAPYAGIDPAHRYFELPRNPGEIYIDVGTYQTGIWVSGWQIDPRYPCRFHGASLKRKNEAFWEAYFDLEVLYQLLLADIRMLDDAYTGGPGFKPPMPVARPVLRRLIHRLGEACDALDQAGVAAFRSELKSLYEELPADTYSGRASLVGHAHIDVVWQWPERVTYRKTLHTFSTALRLLEKYPEFVFNHSTPLLYHHIRENYPEVWKQVKAHMDSGHWEFTGAMEVESDVNITSGEGLARSFLYGQQSFKELRGNTTELLWLPDVFGYSNCLPQLMAQSGVKQFFTTKLSWSAVTRFPYTSFIWRGPDGSEILSHLSPIGYNGQVSVEEIRDGINRNMQTDLFPDGVLAQGYGDGGGGVTEPMLERAKRMGNLSGLPKARWRGAEAFFKDLEGVRDELPIFEGELYLEYHRGTLTTQSELKRLFRASERRLGCHEALRVLSGGAPLTRGDWNRLLLAQFHDAIPGSSITEVYTELNEQLGTLVTVHGDQAREELRGLISTADDAPKTDSPGVSVFNPVPLGRTITMVLPASLAEAGAWERAGLPSQNTKLNGEEAVVVQSRVPGYGAFNALEAVDGAEVEAGERVLNNGIVRAEFSQNGSLTSLAVDGRELAVEGSSLELYPDFPADYDAWDIDRHTLALGERVGEDMKLSLAESGPVRAVLEARAPVGDASSLTIRYILERGADHLGVEVSCDWKESHKLLKYHLRTRYRGARARFGAPFGSVERPQTPGYNNEESQWEVAGQRWASVSDDAEQQGLAVVTEAKYGFSARDGDIGLSLLRSPKHPDESADMGGHLMRFAIGEYRVTSTEMRQSTAAAAETLFGDWVLAEGSSEPVQAFTLAELGSIVPAAVKPAENGEGYLIRLHETAGREGIFELNLTDKPSRVAKTNIVETSSEPLEVDGTLVRVPYSPYEILSLRVE